MNVSISKLPGWDSPGPGWLPIRRVDGTVLKPLIKCRCGQVTGIGLHHVHSDGRVTASFFHEKLEAPDGCGWHVFLKLDNYDYGDFPPEPVEDIL